MTDYSNYRRALTAIVKILGPNATPDGRRSMAGKLATSGNGEVIENLAFSYQNIGLLFNPDDPAAAAQLAKRVRNARESGELQSVIPLAQEGILATDLLAWPDCPPVLEDNPLSYWLPISDGYTSPTGTPKRSAPNGIDGDDKQSEVRTRAALIADVESFWPSIERDLSDATRNGLREAAKHPKHRFWNVEPAIKWATQRGKIIKGKAQSFVASNEESYLSPLLRILLKID